MTTITIVDSLWRHNDNRCYATTHTSQGQAFVCWRLNSSVTCGTVVPRRWTCLSVFLSYSTILVQVKAWCRQATSHYLQSQCWPRSVSPYGLTRPQWVNSFTPGRCCGNLKLIILKLISLIQTCLLFRIGRKPSAFQGQLPTSRIFTNLPLSIKIWSTCVSGLDCDATDLVIDQLPWSQQSIMPIN